MIEFSGREELSFSATDWIQGYSPQPAYAAGGGPRVVVSTAAFHARVRGSVPGLGGLKETKLFLPHPRVKVSIVGSLRDREEACSASDRQGSNFESCVLRTVSSQSSHHPQEVLLARFSLYVHKGGLKPDSFHFWPWRALLLGDRLNTRLFSSTCICSSGGIALYSRRDLPTHVIRNQQASYRWPKLETKLCFFSGTCTMAPMLGDHKAIASNIALIATRFHIRSDVR